MADPVCGPFAQPHPAAALLRRSITRQPTPRTLPPAMLRGAHENLYAQVPAFACEPGCTACCGIVAMTAWEWGEVQDKRQASAGCTTCPYAEGGGCAIHPQRPLICRLFGAVDDPRLQCPKGRAPERKLAPEHARRLMQAYEQLMVDS